MSVELVDVVLVDGFGVRHVQDVEGYPVLQVGVSVKQIGLHPRRVFRVFDKPPVEIGMPSDSVLEQFPVAANFTEETMDTMDLKRKNVKHLPFFQRIEIGGKHLVQDFRNEIEVALDFGPQKLFF